MEKIELSIIVISYNTREMTLECLRSVFSETKKTNFELIVLDNTSDDGSADAIELEFNNRINLIRSEQNIGFAAGNNIAALHATGNQILLLNPDTVVLNGAIDKLVAFSINNPKSGIWGGRTLFKDHSLNRASCWSKQTLWSLICQAIGLTTIFRDTTLFNPEGIGGWDRIGTRHVDIVSGCFFLINKKLWDSLGGFNEHFFMYGEEADLCLRAIAFDVQPMVTSDATIIHYGGASEKVRTDKIIKLLSAKNMLISLYFSPFNRRLGHLLLYLWPVTRYISHSILSKLGRAQSRASAEVWHKVIKNKIKWQ